MKPVKLFDDYLQMAADAANMSKEQYTATYLVPEKRTDINRFSPMAYAQYVLDGEMSVIDAAAESGIGIAGLVSLIQKIDKKFRFVIKEGDDHEVGMAQGQLEAIINAAMDLQEKIGGEEQDMPGWIQSHITTAYEYIKQANDGYHELKESELNEKMKIIMRSILNKMIPAAFGASSNPKMRDEMRDAIQAAIEPILTKYEYLVESKESDALAKEIDKAIVRIDDSMSYEDFALAVGKILKDEYGSHNFGPFMKVLHKDLGI